MKLIQLPNGDWVSPAAIRGIRKLPSGFCAITQTIFEPRFVVDMANGMAMVIECADAEEVVTKADALARRVNEALNG